MDGLTRRRAMSLLGAAALWPAAARAQDFPTRPITLLHGFAAGGTADSVSRVLAGPLGTALGQTVVVEPRPGAGGSIAAAALSRAAADGHTIGLLTGGHAVSAAFGQNLNYEPVEGFEFVGQVLRYAFVVAVRADHPARSLGDLLEMARARPGGLHFGSAGTGSTHHLVGEALNAMAGVQMVHVPYRGEAGAITALLAGDLPVLVSTTVSTISYAREGKLRLLAVTGPRRSTRLPEVPTVAEAALPGFEVTTWAGIGAPRSTPSAVVRRLNEATVQVLAQPAVTSRLEELVDGEVATSTPAEMREMVVSEIARWQELIRKQRITLG